MCPPDVEIKPILLIFNKKLGKRALFFRLCNVPEKSLCNGPDFRECFIWKSS